MNLPRNGMAKQTKKVLCRDFSRSFGFSKFKKILEIFLKNIIVHTNFFKYIIVQKFC